MSKNVKPGFRPNGDGPDGERYGRDPVTGRSFLRDGTLRKERTARTALQVVADAERTETAAMRNIGRGIIKAVPTLAAFVASAGTFRKWYRDAVSYGTPEAVTERRAYFQRMLDRVDAKAAAAARFLPGARKAGAMLDGLTEKVGRAVAAFMRANGGALPDDAALASIVESAIPAEDRAVVEAAADPAADPFAEFRRDAADVGPTDDDDDDDLSNA